MKIKLTRDEARAVQENFFPFLEMLLETKIQENRKDADLQLNFRVIRCNFLEVVKIFTRKLAGDANRFEIKFTEAQGITLFKLLMNLPLQPEAVFLIQLRQRIITALHLMII